MKKRTRWILIAAALAAVIAYVLLASSKTPITVDTAEIRRDTLREAVSEEGRTRVQERFVVAAPVTGRLGRLSVEEGDHVAQGALLGRIFPAPSDLRDLGVSRAQVQAADARVRQTSAAVGQARALVSQVQRELERSRMLAGEGALSRERLEQDELAAETAQQQLDAAEATRRAAEADAQAARSVLQGAAPQSNAPGVPVTAPTGGRVLRVLEKSERIVAAGTPLLELGNAAGLEVVVDVLSEDAVRISPGDPVYFDEWGGEGVLRGLVRLVEPDAFTEVSALGVEEQRVNVITDLFSPPSSLGSGYRVEAQIAVWIGEGVLTVPTSALFQQDGQWHVFAVVDGRAALRPVTIGHRSEEAAEVIGGLSDGDRVILFPSDVIQDGTAVSL